MLILVVLIASSTVMFVLGAIILAVVLRNKKGEETNNPAPPKTETTTTDHLDISDGDMRKISRNGSYLAFDFDASRGKGKMCNAAVASSADGAATFKFTKETGGTNTWIVATDCDGDGNFTSYLTRGNDMIEAKLKDDLQKQRWSIDCGTSGCSFKSKKDGRYLAGTFTKPQFTTNPVYYTIK